MSTCATVRWPCQAGMVASWSQRQRYAVQPSRSSSCASKSPRASLPLRQELDNNIALQSPDDDAASAARSGNTSPWNIVALTLSEGARALALTPRQQGVRKSVGRFSSGGQQALAGALQVAIARHPILTTISPDLRRDVAAACLREVKVRAGAVVAAQGADCDAFAVVGSGIFDGPLASQTPTWTCDDT